MSKNEKARKMLLEELLKQLDEKEKLEERDASFVAGQATDIEKLTQPEKESSGDKLLDLSNISRMLIRGTESDNRLQSVEDSFETLRGANPRLDSLNNPDGFTENLINALDYYFNPPEDLLNNPCIGLGNLLSRQLILDAYLSIFKEYNNKVAGFVNESFLAGLLGGKTIPAEGGTNIADFSINGVGVSLKTSDYSGKLSGSFKNLLTTLGIKFRIEGTTVGNDIGNPQNPKGLFYLLFNKTEDGHMITCFEIDREGIITTFENLSNSAEGALVGKSKPGKRRKRIGITKDEEDYFVFGSSDEFDKLKEYLAPVLDSKFDSIISGNILGVSNLKKSQNKISKQLPELYASQGDNSKKILETLGALNQFYSIYSNAVLKFATDPSLTNLELLQDALLKASQFEPAKLVSTEC